MNNIVNNSFVGKVFYILSYTDSTNEYAKKLLSKTKPVDGTAILSFEQQKGKGQYGRKWFGNKGENIYLSVIFYPDFIPVDSGFDLSRSIALAVADFFAIFLKKEVIQIKWPNDIYVNNKKICGILIENNLENNNLKSSIVGIGINVNQTVFPEEVLNATSLSAELNQEFDIVELARKLFIHLEERYLQLKTQGVTLLRDNFDNQLYGFKEKKRFLQDNEFEILAEICGTNEWGHLLLKKDGVTSSYELGRLKWLD